MLAVVVVVDLERGKVNTYRPLQTARGIEDWNAKDICVVVERWRIEIGKNTGKAEFRFLCA